MRSRSGLDTNKYLGAEAGPGSTHISESKQAGLQINVPTSLAPVGKAL